MWGEHFELMQMGELSKGPDFLGSLLLLGLCKWGATGIFQIRVCVCLSCSGSGELSSQSLAYLGCSITPCPFPLCPKHPSFSSLAGMVKLIRSNYGGRRDPRGTPQRPPHPPWPSTGGPGPGGLVLAQLCLVRVNPPTVPPPPLPLSPLLSSPCPPQPLEPHIS